MLFNSGTVIQRIAAIVLALAVMAFFAVLIIELSNQNVWDFGSLGAVVLIESLILVCGAMLSALLYGFGEIVICINDIRDIME